MGKAGFEDVPLKHRVTVRIARRNVLLAACFLVTVPLSGRQAKAPTVAATPPAQRIPEALGWHEIPNTKLSAICPQDGPLQGNSGCGAVISAWNGGIADTEKNQLIFFGGGHFDYYGNELYVLDLNQLLLRRLTDPSPITNLATCPESYVDGRPAARHTYNGLAYLTAEHSLYLFGGAKSPCGKMSDATWILDLSTMQWSQRVLHRGDTPFAAPGAAADFDPATGLVFMTDSRGFYSYDPRSNVYAHLNSYNGVDYHLTGVIDPARRIFLLMGGGGQLWSIDIRPRSKYELKDLSRTQHGCEALTHAAYPGLAYDSSQKLVVGWAGSDSVYVFQPETVTCKAVTYPGGPGPAQSNGTNGRFRYFPLLGIFAVVNDWKQNAYTLRLTPAHPEAAR